MLKKTLLFVASAATLALLTLCFAAGPQLKPEKTKTEPQAAAATKKQNPQPAAQPTPQPAAQNTQQVNELTQASMKVGISACAGRINQVTNFLLGQTPKGTNTVIFLPPANQDKSLVSFSMEVPSQNASVYVSTSFAPNQANGCGGMYEAMAYWPQNCAAVAAGNFGTLKKIESFAKNIIALDGGVSTRIFLMPAGSGCMSIKKEVVQ